MLQGAGLTRFLREPEAKEKKAGVFVCRNALLRIHD